MKWHQLSQQQREMLASLYRKGQRELLEKAKAEFGLDGSIKTMERQIRNMLFYGRQFQKEVAAQAVQEIPPSPRRKYLDYPKIESDNFLVISDIEVPDHNAHMLKIALLDAMNHNVRCAIWAGDLVAADQAAINTWAQIIAERDEDPTMARDAGLLSEIIDAYARWMLEQYAFEGNHDYRMAKTTGGQIHLGMLLDETQITYSRYPYMYIKTSTRGWIKAIHPGSYSKNPVTLAQRLYNSERGPDYPESVTKCHMILAHCHRAQMGFSEDGLYEMHAIGTMRDDLRTQYKAHAAKAYPQWDSGYLIVIDGHMYNRTLRSTNWREVLGEYYEASPFVTDQTEMLIPYMS